MPEKCHACGKRWNSRRALHQHERYCQALKARLTSVQSAVQTLGKRVRERVQTATRAVFRRRGSDDFDDFDHARTALRDDFAQSVSRADFLDFVNVFQRLHASETH